MFLEKVFPFTAAPKKQKAAAFDVSKVNLSKVFKIKALGLNFNSGISSYLDTTKINRGSFEFPPYDFERIVEAIDTDSYIKQGMAKYRELFWKEGWDIISENSEAVSYLWQRIDLMEEIMKKPFNTFLMEVADQLVKFSNVFIVESRGDITPMYPGRLYPPEEKMPIAGYYIIPTENVKIYRDKNNRPVAYRQVLDETTHYATGVINQPTWKAEEVIHLYQDKKPGRAFGTPFLISVLDDVIALRQIEEDIQNLVHKELFPLYKYKVGTESQPSSPEEIENAASELSNLRVEGGLILPERHDVEVIGGRNSALDANEYLQQFKERVAVGMGLSPHHLGMLASGGNRSVTDRLDIALYDKIKLMQAYIEDCIRLFIFNPLLREGGFDPSLTPSTNSVSDRCYMKFREIDIDTQIKKETHLIQLFSNNVADLQETRIKLGLGAEVDGQQLLMAMQSQQSIMQQTIMAKVNAETKQTTASKTKALPQSSNNEPIKPDAVQPSRGGTPNTPNNVKHTGNIIRPANQHGRRNSPNIRHMDENVLSDIVNLLENEDKNE
jgi:hypothetical protein